MSLLRSMKLFISSPDVGRFNKNMELLEKYGCKYVLYSYYNLRKKEILKFFNIKAEVFLDSGAHTLQKPGKDVDWDMFLYEYIAFINKYKKYIDYIVELDVENKTGLKWVEKARKEIEDQTGIQPIIVWHRERGWDYYLNMCENYKYVGFSGFVEDQTGQPEVPDRFIPLFVKTAHDRGAKIHAFGYTRSDLCQYKFDSADSSSWASGVRYARLVKFEKDRMKSYKDVKGFALQSYDKVIEWNVREWVKYQEFLDNRIS